MIFRGLLLTVLGILLLTPLMERDVHGEQGRTPVPWDRVAADARAAVSKDAKTSVDKIEPVDVGQLYNETVGETVVPRYARGVKAFYKGPLGQTFMQPIVIIYEKVDNVWTLAGAQWLTIQEVAPPPNVPSAPIPPSEQAIREGLGKYIQSSWRGLRTQDVVFQGKPTFEWREDYQRTVYTYPVRVTLLDEKNGAFGKKWVPRFVCDITAQASRRVDEDEDWFIGTGPCKNENPEDNNCYYNGIYCTTFW
ncbi:MAG: hypothetical protein KBD85_01270 [Elusimicrobia bacterium]|nr:hypothetical protein [Elusimicrobiota bacterium]